MRQKDAAVFVNVSDQPKKKCPWCQFTQLKVERINIPKPFPCSYAFQYCVTCNEVLFRFPPTPVIPLEDDQDRMPPPRESPAA